MKKKLKDLCEEFLKYLDEIRGYSTHSIITYEIALRQMRTKSHFYEEDDKTILDISPFRFDIVKQNKKTIVKKLSAIRSLVKYLEEQCLIEIKLVGDESIKVPKSLPKPIEKKYIEEVLAEASLQQKLLITMLYGLGLRISELSFVRVEDIKGQWIQIKGKGNKMRELPLLPSLKRLIHTYIQAYVPQNYLFEKSEKPMNTAQLRYALEKVFKAQGLKVTPHQLRHSFATHLLNNGARISDISELLGHETMASTQVYTQLSSHKKLKDYMSAHPLSKKD
ncbi:Tyrosine recombinase XerC [hydrothermal vent metagenome]|uniref:Tyrosine recombinase XerC n=1 Tax=hydrothermal vent metagenome TaxID=652676 RepID=A0A1W1CS50_9ZZZZ